MGYYASGHGTLILKKDMKVPTKILADLGREFDEVADTPDGGMWLTHEYGKYHDDDMTEALQKIAPFVAKGDVEFSGDDDINWRFHFYDGKMRYQEGRIVYEDSDPDWRHCERMELLGCFADVVDDWLEERLIEKGLTPEDIQCEDRKQAIDDGEDPEGLAITYGEDYDRLTGHWEQILINFGLIEKEEK